MAPEAAPKTVEKAKQVAVRKEPMFLWLWRSEKSKTKIHSRPFSIYPACCFSKGMAQKNGHIGVCMKKRSPTYTETSGCLAPKDSAEFASWLQSLPPYLRDIMLADLEARTSQQITAKQSRPAIAPRYPMLGPPHVFHLRSRKSPICAEHQANRKPPKQTK